MEHSTVTFNHVNYDPVLLLRLGEITLKGQNRSRFENQIMRSLRRRLKDVAPVNVRQEFSRLWIEGEADNFPIGEILKKIRPVFGYVSASPVRRLSSEPEKIKEEVLDYMVPLFEDGEPFTFKFVIRRVDKNFEMNSYDLACYLGDAVLAAYPEQAKVDVHDPDYEFTIEIRERGNLFLYHQYYEAFRGLPVGMSGEGLVLLSGGIDSPVAAFRMASRGMKMEAMYFHTHPYTSEEAKEKVIKLAEILATYTGNLRLHVVDFTPTQMALNEHVPEELMTVIMRRMMFRIADAFADKYDIGALVSGESLGQVASQTLEALARVNHLPSRPIFRPLIGMDKEEIVALSKEIGTYETSILPYEDCCTVFVAKHPKTRPHEEECVRAEAGMDVDLLVKDALNRIETIDLTL